MNYQKIKTTDKFVSRGGLKLQSAIENWNLNLKDLVVLDVGSSTGGFVDCLLQNGAKVVYSVDTCYGELAWKLRNDKRVVLMERTNILHLENLPNCHLDPESTEGERSQDLNLEIPRSTRNDKSGDNQETKTEGPERTSRRIDLITIDAGWTKLELSLPAVKKFLKINAQIIALLKPQYEAQKHELQKGVIRPEFLRQIKDRVFKTINELGFTINYKTDSPILGGGGNREYLLLLTIKG